MLTLHSIINMFWVTQEERTWKTKGAHRAGGEKAVGVVLNETNPPNSLQAGYSYIKVDRYIKERAFQTAIIVITTEIDARGNRRE